MFSFSKLQLREFIESCTQMGVAYYIREQSPKDDRLSQREAYERFGESCVKRLVREGLVIGHRVGIAKNSKKVFSRADLLTALMTEKAFKATKIRYNNEED